MKKPNVVFVLADQWRKQATGYNGDPNVKTPNLDQLAKECLNLTNAISACPVCTPYRASFLTGQYPLTTGLFINDVPLNPEIPGLGDAFKAGGYDTAYIGKWHVDGHGKKAFIPKKRRKGFDYWKVLECTHEYNRSAYYDGDCEEIRQWDGYDAIAQTDDACEYVKNHDPENPFILVLSFGPPHDQGTVPEEDGDWYFGAPDEYREGYDENKIQLRPNVPETEQEAKRKLAGYYAHCTALDACVGKLLSTIQDQGIEEDTIFVFNSDHGDMLGSHGPGQKQFPWEESICIPFLLRYPQKLGREAHESDVLIEGADIMPTLLGLADVTVPDSVEGTDFSKYLTGECALPDEPVIIASYVDASGYYEVVGGMDYRGVRTKQHTYTRNAEGPWLLFDNHADPYQMNNLANQPEFGALQKELDDLLSFKLKERGDEFCSGDEYMKAYDHHPKNYD